MRTVTTRHAVLALGALLVAPLIHCGGGGVEPGPSSETSPDGGSNDGPDGGSCVPKTCADTARCGTYDDGCGGTLRCEEECKCTPNDFEVTCPPRPCEVVAGCVDQVCQYAPIACGAPGAEEACAPVACDGDGCGDVATSAGDSEKLYACGGNVCKDTTFYCDPGAVVEGGKVVFQNRCVAPPRDGCGTCGLAVSSCDDATDRFVCDSLSVPVAEGGGIVECDSTVAGSTFVFVDAQYTGGGSDGSRSRPYTSYAAALSAAQARNARGIVIAGSPVFTEALVVKSGISVYGGFDAAPGFLPNRAQRPRWAIPATAAAANKLVGATARDIVDGTVLYHLDIETADAIGQHDGQGTSNIALWVQHSTALRLEEVNVRAGAASAGADGVDGQPGSGGGDAVGPEPGIAGAGCSTTCAVTSPAPPAVNGNKCGAGGRTDPNEYLPNAAKAGNANGKVGSLLRSGGLPGVAGYDNSRCPADSATDGRSGSAGVEGESGQDAAGGARPVIAINGVSMAERKSGANGVMGTWGSGGGAGGSYMDGCMNDPNRGGAGGGAGGPGCGGTFGTGGGAGGFSAAIVLVGSSQSLVLRSSTVTGGKGGKGGNAGMGGTGGNGGNGAAGASGEGSSEKKAGDGGAGGSGGRGGRGGHGGGGAAGSSFGIWCEATSMNVTRDSATTIGAGAAGAVGTSLGNDGAVGESTAVANCMTP